MKISVIIPVYNTEKYLKECVESVLAQTYHNLEILLINDGATDSSPQICELYAVWKRTDGSFDTHNIIHDDGMFNGSIELEGQNGTGFSRDHVDSEYGRIDKEGQPGYFTNRYK